MDKRLHLDVMLEKTLEKWGKVIFLSMNTSADNWLKDKGWADKDALVTFSW